MKLHVKIKLQIILFRINKNLDNFLLPVYSSIVDICSRFRDMKGLKASVVRSIRHAPLNCSLGRNLEEIYRIEWHTGER